ncbi:hypothetical protein FMN52_16005 [Marinobacter sp. BW6]|uniref:hypothetical protein n=1 Tax=Marinobacter sp. BW6 TaxID=2592624 RepID=UPI0011DEB2F4|nr:hypothetical protein [Marinobacter sp. BW6]TYC58041.1 hypothetical protein FMN52_16005 [Marinobacter sp. BW6]
MTPFSVIFGSIFFYLTVWLVSPVEVKYSPSVEAILLLLIGQLSLIIGWMSCRIFVPPSARPVKVELTDSYLRSLRAAFKILLLLAVLSVFFKFVDKVLVRDVLSYGSAAERRYSLESTSIFGILAGPFYALCLSLPAFVTVLNLKGLSKLFVIILFFVPAVEILFIGSRGIVLVTLFILFFYTRFVFKVKMLSVALLSAVGITLFYVSGMILLNRLEAHGISPLYSAFHSNYAFTLVPSSFGEKLAEDGGIFSVFYFVVINFAQYYLHGALEFSFLFDNFEQYDHKFGIYTFSVIAKFFGVSVGPDFLESASPRSGIYTTILGPLWVDFGFFAFLFLALWGRAMTVCYYKFCSGNIEYLPLYAYMSAVVFFAPVVNLIQSALGVYILVSFFTTIFLVKIFKRRFRPIPNE